LKTKFTFKTGELSCEQCVIPFDFGHVFEDEGVLRFEFYVHKDFDLASLITKPKTVFTDFNFKMKSTTVDLNIIEATGLLAKTIDPHFFRIEMVSEGVLVHTDLSSYPDNAKLELNDLTLYYIEFEGLNMVQTDVTEVSKTRRGEDVSPWNNLERDHTPLMVIYDGDISQANFFHFTFFKSDSTDNIIAEFSNKNEKPPTPIKYGYWQTFKREFLYLLSFLNGGEVKIKNEHLGGFVSSKGIKTQTEIFYSHPVLGARKTTGYIPINNKWYIDKYILHHSFTNCFNNYVKLNKLLDFNSIIYYLNGAQQVDSFDERFFISIIAFERLASTYAVSFNLSDENIVPDDKFEPIKIELIRIIKGNKNILGEGYSKIIQKISEVHKIKATSVRYKFKHLLEYAKVPVTEDIKNIIDKIRNTSIHSGEIGEGKEGIKNYYVLDEMIRDIILNLIEYKGPRYSAYKKNNIE